MKKVHSNFFIVLLWKSGWYMFIPLMQKRVKLKPMPKPKPKPKHKHKHKHKLKLKPKPTPKLD